MAALVFTAGLLTVAAVEDVITKAHESAEDAPDSVLAVTGDFVLFTFVSAGLGAVIRKGSGDHRQCIPTGFHNI